MPAGCVSLYAWACAWQASLASVLSGVSSWGTLRCVCRRNLRAHQLTARVSMRIPNTPCHGSANNSTQINKHSDYHHTRTHTHQQLSLLINYRQTVYVSKRKCTATRYLKVANCTFINVWWKMLASPGTKWRAYHWKNIWAFSRHYIKLSLIKKLLWTIVASLTNTNSYFGRSSTRSSPLYY